MSYHIVGHFGSRLSYATVASNVARAMRARGLLAGVTNLDDKMLPEYEELFSERTNATHVVLFVDPSNWLFEAMASQYGAQNVAVFASPNTDTLLLERAKVCSKAGMVLAPSQWCLDTVDRTLSFYSLPRPTWACLVPLGVSGEFLGAHGCREASAKLRLLHLATDFSWPGRKGTEELLHAWSMVQRGLAPFAELLIHVPMAIYEAAHYAVADLGLEGVRIEIAPERGSTDAQLAALYETADVVVLPSRCEGFGMMMLAACVSGTPLVTTYVTGQTDFLAELDGWLGVPCSYRTEKMEHETGLCPVVEPRAVATALLAACSPMVLEHLRAGARSNVERSAMRWRWDVVVEEWMETLERWRNP